MSVAGYEKVKTKVIEGKKKCIYKKYKGTKLYVKGFGKMRSVESYIKLCKKAAAKSAKSAKPMKAKKARSKTARKYGGFLQEFFTNMEKMETSANGTTTKKPASTSDVAKGDTASPATPPATPPAPPATPPAEMSPKVGGSSCSRKGGSRGGNSGLGQLFNAFSASGGYRGGQSLDQFNNQTRDQFNNQMHDQFQNQMHDKFQSLDQFQDQNGGRRRKRNKGAKSMLDKLMMAANFRKRSAKKGKKPRRNGGSSQLDY